MDKEMQLKLKLAMNQLESACEAMELVVEACCPEDMPEMKAPQMPKRIKMMMTDTGSSED